MSRPKTIVMPRPWVKTLLDCDFLGTMTSKIGADSLWTSFALLFMAQETRFLMSSSLRWVERLHNWHYLVEYLLWSRNCRCQETWSPLKMRCWWPWPIIDLVSSLRDCSMPLVKSSSSIFNSDHKVLFLDHLARLSWNHLSHSCIISRIMFTSVADTKLRDRIMGFRTTSRDKMVH